jgi:hypothetical protein
MFRKMWKAFKIFIILAIAVVCIPHSLFPVQKGFTGKDDLENYLKLNDRELRLIEYKDDNESLELKLMQLGNINISRKRYNAAPVKLDILASRVANKMCLEAAEKGFVGHWNTAGEKPYHRYAFAGGYDHVSENAFGEWSSDNYKISNAIIASMMKSGHDKFMAERSPNDGHKKTIIEKSHNYIGIGYHLSGKQFRYFEEFIDRYLEFENIPSAAKVDTPVNITVRTNDNNFLYFLVIYYEKVPEILSTAQLSKKGSYADFSDEEFKSIAGWDLSRLRSGNIYRIPLTFSKEGLYYIQIYQDKKELTSPGSLNTKGKTPVSGIVIKVDK